MSTVNSTVKNLNANVLHKAEQQALVRKSPIRSIAGSTAIAVDSIVQNVGISGAEFAGEFFKYGRDQLKQMRAEDRAELTADVLKAMSELD